MAIVRLGILWPQLATPHTLKAHHRCIPINCAKASFNATLLSRLPQKRVCVVICLSSFYWCPRMIPSLLNFCCFCLMLDDFFNFPLFISIHLFFYFLFSYLYAAMQRKSLPLLQWLCLAFLKILNQSMCGVFLLYLCIIISVYFIAVRTLLLFIGKHSAAVDGERVVEIL